MIFNPKDIKFKAGRAGGPGGQRTNRRSTKVQLWIQIDKLPLTKLQKKQLRKKLAKHINHKDEIEVMADEERSQEMNREAAVKRLNKVILDALKVPKKRIPTKPSRRSEDNRIAEKKIISAKKQSRRLSK